MVIYCFIYLIWYSIHCYHHCELLEPFSKVLNKDITPLKLWLKLRLKLRLKLSLKLRLKIRLKLRLKLRLKHKLEQKPNQTLKIKLKETWFFLICCLFDCCTNLVGAGSIFSTWFWKGKIDLDIFVEGSSFRPCLHCTERQTHDTPKTDPALRLLRVRLRCVNMFVHLFSDLSIQLESSFQL